MAKIDLRGLPDHALAGLPDAVAGAVAVGWMSGLFGAAIDANPFVRGALATSPTRVDLRIDGVGMKFDYELTGRDLVQERIEAFGVRFDVLSAGTVESVRLEGRIDGVSYDVAAEALDLSAARLDDILRPAVEDEGYPMALYAELFGLGWQVIGRPRADDLRPAVPGVDFAGDDRFDLRGGDDRAAGGRGNDVLLGGAGDDLLWGDAGRDVLRGGLGADGLWGGRGDDALDGGAGRDLLRGGDGRDVLAGGAGRDGMWGGRGADLFVFAPGGGADVVHDFEAGRDRLDFGGRDVRLIAAQDGDAVILHGGGRVVLDGVAAAGFDLGGALGFVVGAADGGAAGPGGDLVGGAAGEAFLL